MPDKTLINLWSSLNQARKTAIAITLQTYFNQLRQLPHPGYFGNIIGGPPLNNIFSATMGTSEVVKISFATEDKFINTITRIYSFETGKRTAHKLHYY